MRLEYTEEQEKQLRITEIESILENNLRENKTEIFALEVELQFLQGYENGFGEHMASVVVDTGETLEIIFRTMLDEHRNVYIVYTNRQSGYSRNLPARKTTRKGNTNGTKWNICAQQ